MAYNLAAISMLGEDENNEFMRETVVTQSLSTAQHIANCPIVEEFKDKIANDGLDAQAILEDETRDALADKLNSQDY